ncbi:hypothetical protein B0H14DRAFT_3890679 [Mycena olivaceomarginata]|nr:hypothetical protein B0H14DRAFT_3890679 [Mycena olivaceomarginata]
MDEIGKKLIGKTPKQWPARVAIPEPVERENLALELPKPNKRDATTALSVSENGLTLPTLDSAVVHAGRIRNDAFKFPTRVNLVNADGMMLLRSLLSPRARQAFTAISRCVHRSQNEKKLLDILNGVPTIASDARDNNATRNFSMTGLPTYQEDKSAESVRLSHRLFHLPTRDLLVTTPLVSKTWLALTLTPTLQRALFFQPDTLSTPLQNPLLAEIFPPFFTPGPPDENTWKWPGTARAIRAIPCPLCFNSSRASLTKLARMILEDGIMYFIALTAMNIVNLIFFESRDTTLQSSASSLSFAVTMIFSSRFTLNLSERMRDALSGDSHSSRTPASGGRCGPKQAMTGTRSEGPELVATVVKNVIAMHDMGADGEPSRRVKSEPWGTEFA